jgi:hypothetical protein
LELVAMATGSIGLEDNFFFGGDGLEDNDDGNL